MTLPSPTIHLKHVGTACIELGVTAGLRAPPFVPCERDELNPESGWSAAGFGFGASTVFSPVT
jgi:hypothetical protein